MEKITLYKYLNFSENTLKSISEGTLSFSCALGFNDPFDCFPSVNEKSFADASKQDPKLFKRIVKAKNLSPAKKVEYRSRFNNQLKNIYVSGKMRADILKDFGVLCLTQNPTNILMWSHYANFHRGFVLELEIEHSEEMQLQEFAYNLVPMQVTYVKDRPEIHFQEFYDGEKAVQKFVLTKSDLWEYESEYRVIDYHRGVGIHPYNRNNILKSVICGMNMQEPNKEIIANLINQVNSQQSLSIQLLQAKAKKKTYEIEIFR